MFYHWDQNVQYDEIVIKCILSYHFDQSFYDDQIMITSIMFYFRDQYVPDDEIKWKVVIKDFNFRGL